MVDHQFADAGLAELYDAQHPWESRGDYAFYSGLVMAAESVLDVGCGTGTLLHAARAAGHAGRLCGLDPAAGMIERARKRTDVEWLLGDLTTVHLDREFDLIVMAGHAFQVFVTDDELRTSLASIRSALTENGRFAFETRNPAARAWERWTPDNVSEFVDACGNTVRSWHEVETPLEDDLVSFTTTYTSPAWDRPQESQSTLRFLDAAALSTFLAEVGFVVDEQFGDWDQSLLTETSPEIITLAGR
ncbi:class I SAM-dependent methyltransferase [Amycolatopsis sp.]|jgi:SAM-dependent methyltransferase|uniref:class I SAM-dependent methyltransferase n=1 Tax=Amycolatopsis sp. TaxID=37632 RepID=UPI002DFEA467|nr:class I SAM-dependent methyltransferase [Amycolatopsis sp.]